MKVYISADIEGIGGIVARTQVKPGEHDYQRARILMTNEVNAAIDGALKAGVDEILVNDSHGPMTNIIIEALNPKAELITGSPKKLGMMEGIDPSFDAAILIGYHSRMNTLGVLSHSFHGGIISNISINGKDAGEFYMNALAAGYYNVPIVLVSGDNILADEVRDVSSEIRTAVVKTAHGRYAARCITPSVVQSIISEKVEEALGNIDVIKPLKIQGRNELKVTFLNSGMAEVVSFMPGIEMISPNMVQYNTDDFIECYRALGSMIDIASSI